MIKSILLVDEEPIYHVIFEDACSLLDLALHFQAVSTASEVEALFKAWSKGEGKKPELVLVDAVLNNPNSDGVDLIRRINTDFGNGVVVGVISSRGEKFDLTAAQNNGAAFWLIKSDEIESRLEQLKRDFAGFKSRTLPFKVYS